MRQAGFSLMEILIVIAIIGILVAIALPSYQTYTKRAHFTEITQAVLPLKLAVTQCYQLTLDLAQCDAGLNGIPLKRDNASTKGLLKSISVSANGVIVATPKDRYGFTGEDQYTLTPHAASGQLQWSSGGKAVEKGYAK